MFMDYRNENQAEFFGAFCPEEYGLVSYVLFKENRFWTRNKLKKFMDEC